MNEYLEKLVDIVHSDLISINETFKKLKLLPRELLVMIVKYAKGYYQNIAFRCGGRDEPHGKYNKSSYRFDAKENKWISFAALPFERGDAAAVLHSETSQIFVCGGYGNSDDKYMEYMSQLSVIRYSILDDKWEHTSSMRIARQHHSAVECDNLIYVIGGERYHKLGINTLTSCECFDIMANQWSDLPSLQKARRYHSSVVYKGCEESIKGREFKHIYVLGGNNQGSVERYDIIEKKWKFVTDMSQARWGHASVLFPGEDGSGLILIIGGGLYSSADSKTILKYSISQNKWSNASWFLHEPRYYFSAHLLYDENYYNYYKHHHQDDDKPRLSLLICGGKNDKKTTFSCLRVWVTVSGEYIKMDENEITLPSCALEAVAC